MTIATFHDAKALWQYVSEDWTVKCLRMRTLYVHNTTMKVLPAFIGNPTSGSTPESVLQFHMEKKRLAFHVGFKAYHTSESALTEEAMKEFISMTAYLQDTHQLFVKPCQGFLFGGKKTLDGHNVEFKELDNYKEIDQPGLNLVTITANLIRCRMAYYRHYLRKDAETPAGDRHVQHVPEEHAPEEYPPDLPGAQNSPGAPGAQISPDLPGTPPVVGDVLFHKVRDAIINDPYLKKLEWEQTPVFKRLIKSCIDRGLTDEDEILGKIKHFAKTVDGLEDLDPEHVAMVSEVCEEALPGFFHGVASPQSISTEQKFQHIKDSTTPRKITKANLVQDYNKGICTMFDLGTTPEIQNLLHNRGPAIVNNEPEGRNLDAAFEGAKTPDSDYCEAPVQQQHGKQQLVKQKPCSEGEETIKRLTKQWRHSQREANRYKRVAEDIIGFVGGDPRILFYGTAEEYKSEVIRLKEKRKLTDLDSAQMKDNKLYKQDFSPDYEEKTRECTREFKKKCHKLLSRAAGRSPHPSRGERMVGRI